jgi:acyl dehydratase
MSATTGTPIRVNSPAALADAVGRRATGEWLTIDQGRIDAFADATEDHQWIHVDPERAASGPFGTTIAHGFLTLSLLPRLASSLVEVGGVAMAMNYGLDRVRFLHPVPVGSRVRATTELTRAETVAQGVRLSSTVTIEIEGVEKPALVAEALALYVPAA